ncbi:MAG: SCO family protein, partial [Burkholderiales bacterium]
MKTSTAFLGLSLAMLPALAAAQMGAAPPPRPATPGVLQEVGFDQHLGETVPLDLAFTDEAGRSVKLADYFGKKPVVLSLVYYDCPMLCTLSLNGLAGALEVLSFVPGQEFEVLTVSFDSRETPALAAAKKKAYMARYRRPGAHAGWHFLTGSDESIAAL